jgi:hypothetical protein
LNSKVDEAYFDSIESAIERDAAELGNSSPKLTGVSVNIEDIIEFRR